MRFIAQAGALLALLSSFVASAQAPRLPIEAFVQPPMFSEPRMSPDLSKIAVLVNRPGERTQLAMVDLSDNNSTRMVAAVSTRDVVSAHWMTPTRLVFHVGQTNQLRDEPITNGLWLLDVPSGEVRQLIDDQFNQRPGRSDSPIKREGDRLLPWEWSVVRVLDDGSEDVMVQRIQWDATGEIDNFVLARLNTRTGKLRLETENVPARVRHWSVDRNGKAYACITYDGPNFGVHLFDQDTKSWKRWLTGRRNIDEWPFPLARLTGGDLLVSAYDKGSPNDNIRVVRRLKTTELGGGDTLISIPGYDWDGAAILDPKSNRLLGLTYEADAADTAWFDRDMKALQGEIDKKLPNTINRIQCNDCRNDNRMLVLARSDRQPEVVYLYDRNDASLKILFRSQPTINPADMAPREVLRITARDGLSIPIQLTKPLGASGPRPAVVLVHGGPSTRGNHWFWEGQAQLLANRGYLVIEPEFRGSTGYGAPHENRGRKQWGQAMQADLADAAKWAVEKGLADPKRICIAGASYGGYATLMGLIRDPDIFACGFQWAGVTGLEFLYSRSGTDIGDLYKSYDLPLLVGDPVSDAKMLADNSPINLAAKLKRPLLMAYGVEDTRVAIGQGLGMKKALEAAGYQGLEWIVYPNEGHGWRSLETNVDFWGRVERFLERHIGGAAPKP
ncbi:alpha/beta fold hydrolase [Roseateles sp.]|uniref:alpha/beta hydrolase family protein n=1 Tax=Roseateles sp. TaxID=1971397 RepID=UPI0025CBD615|nr:alpha/beta fold hydrolase [Roseateles sp.]MBV8035173.1 S9 family peptidase [Roseateles sp.]